MPKDSHIYTKYKVEVLRKILTDFVWLAKLFFWNDNYGLLEGSKLLH